MEFIGFCQVFITIMTLLYMWCRSLTFSSRDSSAATEHDDDGGDIPLSREKYDIFVSFRGEDTRLGVTSHLHEALRQKKIETYIDYRLNRGADIRPALLEAIEKSTVSVVIFSRNYASSSWCLDELVHMLKRKEKYGQMVIPIFYDINPSDVGKQQGSYADAFSQLEKRFKSRIDKVHNWRAALKEASGISGFDHSSKTGTEADLVKKVVDTIWNILIRESSCDLKGLVGIKTHIEQIELLLCMNDTVDVCTVGIWGMGGIGKTTVAEAVFRRLYSKFEACCFLKNVREISGQTNGLDCLQNKLLSEILKEKDRPIGSTFVRERLSRTKVLVVLDDVSDPMQMEHLAGDHLRYGTGSRIIITSRDRNTLKQTVEDDKIYEIEGLKPDDAFQLFHLNAFKNRTPTTDYIKLSLMVVDYAGGNPLALKTIGSSFHCKSKEEWEDEFKKLKQFPSEKIQKVLRRSYDELEKNEKEIFLDIACFHKGKRMDDVKKMFDIRGFSAAAGTRVLIDMSLISVVSTWRKIEMHDLLQEMGRKIVLEQCIEEPGKRSRLFTAEDVYHVLRNNTGTTSVQAIFFNRSEFEELELNDADFRSMSKLILLSVDFSKTGDYCKLRVSLHLPNSLRYLYWRGYPLKSLPLKFSPESLVELHMPNSHVQQLWKDDKNLMNLKVINLCYSEDLTEVPNLSRSPKLEHINLLDCESLVKIPSYFEYLDKLTYLNLGCCMRLKHLPEMPGNIEFLSLTGTGIKELPSSVWSNEKISRLNIGYCRNLKKLPSGRCKLKVSGTFNLKHCYSLGEFSELPRDISVLDLTGTTIEVLPVSSLERLCSLTTIQLKNCKMLVTLPTGICTLKSLKELDLTGCSKFNKFPEILEPMEQLEFLSLEGTSIKELHSSIEFLYVLKKLRLKGCEKLKCLPTSICKLKSLEGLDLTGCSAFYEFPEILEPMKDLEFLCLEGTLVKELPSSIKYLIGLETLDLRLCKNFEFFPNSIYSLTKLRTLSFFSCWKLETLLPATVLVSLLSLEVLDLSYSGISEIPPGLICLTSLRDLDLSGTKIKNIPASIKQASQLSRLCLIMCNSLESLPELPVLCCLEADGCTSLKTVSSSRTALVQCWDKFELFPGVQKFSNCRALDQNAKSNIMADAQLRILRVATASSMFIEEDNVSLSLSLSLSLPFFLTLVIELNTNASLLSNKLDLEQLLFSYHLNNTMSTNVIGKVPLSAAFGYHCMPGKANSNLVQLSKWGIFGKHRASTRLVSCRVLGFCFLCCCCIWPISAFEVGS
ncbi:disease resistance protein RPV1-like [Pyrus communis]|uniref:disease resistance protein RPV1-like n=1 Tax=Pyrus communis TaxID=23211 RepID=UPI0035C1B32E